MQKSVEGLPIVRGSMDDLKPLQCAHSHSWSCVKIEHEEGGGDRNEGIGCIGCQAVGDGAHGVLSHTIVDVSSTVVAGDAARCLQVGLIIVSVLF
jgi:hypothetical protein